MAVWQLKSHFADGPETARCLGLAVFIVGCFLASAVILFFFDLLFQNFFLFDSQHSADGLSPDPWLAQFCCPQLPHLYQRFEESESSLPEQPVFVVLKWNFSYLVEKELYGIFQNMVVWGRGGRSGAREMAQGIRALAALAEDPGSILNTHTVAHSCL